MIRYTAMLLSLLTGIAVAGCTSTAEPTPAVKPVVVTPAVTQTCDHCGAVYHTRAFDGKEISPTMDWCFECGRFCQVGFELLAAIQGLTIDEIQSGQLKSEMMEHCQDCFGCKAAMFRDKSEWESALAEYESERSE